MQVVFINQKIEKFLQKLQPASLAKAIRMIQRIEKFGSELEMPHSKKIDHHLFELRVRGHQEIRIFYCFLNGQAVLLHGFIKKTQKTPQREIETAKV